VTVSVSMTMDGLDASSITDDDLDAIAVGLAAVIDGVDSDDIYNVVVTDASSRRRSLLSTAATVEFDVMVDLSSDDVTFASVDDLEASLSSDMAAVEADSSALITAIKDEVVASGDDDGSKWDDVTGVSGVETQAAGSPTEAPTPEPTAKPTAEPTAATVPAPAPTAAPVPAPAPTATVPAPTTADDGSGGDSAEAADGSGAIIGAVVGVVVVAGGFGAWKFMGQKNKYAVAPEGAAGAGGQAFAGTTVQQVAPE